MIANDEQMELVSRYQSGEATLEETQRLGGRLLSDAALRRDFLAYARIDAALAAAVRPHLAVTRVSVRRMRRWRTPLALAAAAALVVTGIWFSRPEPASVQLATASGDVRVWRAQVTTAVRAGFVLKPGDWLLTGKDGAAEIEFPGETTKLKIGADADFGVVTVLPDKQLKLTAGTLHASVARQSASHPMLIRTPTAKAEVLGTKFEMSATEERTEMTVTEGRVLIARTEDESGVVVETSQTATVTDKEPVAVKTPSVAQSLDTGLLGRWKFDEGSGVVAADSSGNGRDLSLSAAGAWGEGYEGKALDLHAAKVDVESPQMELPDVFSISLWLRIQHGGPARPQPLLGCQGGAGEFWLTVPPNFPGSAIILTISGREMGSQAHSMKGVILAGQWHHLTVTVDSTQGRATFHVDGRDVTEASGLRRDFKLAGSLLIGRRVKGGPLPFDGQIDDVRIYGRILSGAEISKLAQTTGGSK